MNRALQLIIDDLYKVYNNAFPTIANPILTAGGSSTTLGQVQNFTGVAFPNNLRLQWDDLPGAFRYQIKLGDDWTTAVPIITTSANTVNLDPVQLNLIYGTYTFLIKPIDISGNFGDVNDAELIVEPIGQPDLDLDVVSNNVILRWTIPNSTWKVDHYIVKRNSVEIGTISGTFKLLQEMAGGTYSYSVAAVDIVGNVGSDSAVQVADLHDPSDFEFVASLLAAYTGTYVKCEKTNLSGVDGIIGPIDIVTWSSYFTSHGWTTLQDAINAGYPLYFQPSYNGVGTYEEVFDFGSIRTSLTVVANFSKLQLAGTTSVVTAISYSNDNITYSSPVTASSVFATSFRYVKVKWTFTNSDNLSAAFISNLQVILNVTLTLDSGNISALASDASGTVVTYNKTFISVNSVTATPAVSTQPLYAVTDAITSSTFKVLVFDSSGNRINATINWKARGVI